MQFAKSIIAGLLKPPVSRLRLILIVAIPFWVMMLFWNLLRIYLWRIGQHEEVIWLGSSVRIAQHVMLLLIYVGLTYAALTIGWPVRRRLRAGLLQLCLSVIFALAARASMLGSLYFFDTKLEPELQSLGFFGLLQNQLFGDPQILRLTADTGLRFLATYWFGLILIVGLKMYLELRDQKLRAAELETKWLKVRLDNLYGQLNPHFLFNSLHTISSFVDREPQRADKLIADLSELLRQSLKGKRLPFVSVREELDFIQRYLRIEQTRFDDRLKVVIEADEDILNARVPSLILQPLVENAVKHGVSRVPGRGELRVSVEHQPGRLILRVGNTFDPEAALEPADDNVGIGLQNTRDRLEAIYGGDYGFTIGPDAGCWNVRIELPLEVSGSAGLMDRSDSEAASTMAKDTDADVSV